MLAAEFFQQSNFCGIEDSGVVRARVENGGDLIVDLDGDAAVVPGSVRFSCARQLFFCAR